MTWLFAIAAWLAVVFFASQVVADWRDITRCISPSKKYYHSMDGCVSIAALYIVWTRWSWSGLALAVALWTVASVFLAISARLWLVRLLRVSPERADIFMRDP